GGKPFAEVEPHGIGNIKFEEVFPNISFPDPPVPEREIVDLHPNVKSIIVDKGEVIPNINDNYLGSAPDCGAYEAEQVLPIYGPRPFEIDEENSIQKSYHKYRSFDRSTETQLATIKVGTSNLTIEYVVKKGMPIKISILDFLGREVRKIEEGYRKQGSYKISVPFINLSSGCYLIWLQSNNCQSLRNFVVR
ncbi:MAG: T9SS type A sorting domain-containing protein, partial [Chitinispirillaceae bacterium]|nr:T9SS type A sorting domain-containing protein [Chitinispirillaceae bacterium]